MFSWTNISNLNQAQYRIIRALATAKNSIKDLCVIGDPDQAIYGFRGSDVKFFNRFISDYPGTGVSQSDQKLSFNENHLECFLPGYQKSSPVLL